MGRDSHLENNTMKSSCTNGCGNRGMVRFGGLCRLCAKSPSIRARCGITVTRKQSSPNPYDYKEVGQEPVTDVRELMLPCIGAPRCKVVSKVTKEYMDKAKQLKCMWVVCAACRDRIGMAELVDELVDE